MCEQDLTTAIEQDDPKAFLLELAKNDSRKSGASMDTFDKIIKLRAFRILNALKHEAPLTYQAVIRKEFNAACHKNDLELTQALFYLVGPKNRDIAASIQDAYINEFPDIALFFIEKYSSTTSNTELHETIIDSSLIFFLELQEWSKLARVTARYPKGITDEGLKTLHSADLSYKYLSEITDRDHAKYLLLKDSLYLPAPAINMSLH